MQTFWFIAIFKELKLTSLVLFVAIGASSLGAALRDDGSFTLLAPTNTAFSKLDQSLLKKILSDTDCLDSEYLSCLLVT